jgi:hypothetical protein
MAYWVLAKDKIIDLEKATEISWDEEGVTVRKAEQRNSALIEELNQWRARE